MSEVLVVSARERVPGGQGRGGHRHAGGGERDRGGGLANGSQDGGRGGHAEDRTPVVGVVSGDRAAVDLERRGAQRQADDQRADGHAGDRRGGSEAERERRRDEREPDDELERSVDAEGDETEGGHL